jgi:hypothetical protein
VAQLIGTQILEVYDGAMPVPCDYESCPEPAKFSVIFRDVSGAAVSPRFNRCGAHAIYGIPDAAPSASVVEVDAPRENRLSDDFASQRMSPALRTDLDAIIANGPSLQGRLDTGEQLKELQQRFAESAAARGVDLEQVSQDAFEEIHPGRTRRD